MNFLSVQYQLFGLIHIQAAFAHMIDFLNEEGFIDHVNERDFGKITLNRLDFLSVTHD